MLKRRRDQFGKGSALSTVIYILIIILLLGCMGYLYFYSKQQKQSSRDRINQLKLEESGAFENVGPAIDLDKNKGTSAEESTEDTSAAEISSEEESTDEESSEEKESTSAETKSAAENESKPVSTEKTTPTKPTQVSDEETSSESVPTESSSGSQTNEESKPSAHTVHVADPNAAKKELSVIVLNGTRMDGVAGYWKGCLQAEGFEHIVAATYKAAVESETVLYVAEEKQAEYFKKLFPNAKVKVASLEDHEQYIEIAADQDASDTYDVWVVVGMNDARAE